MWRIIWSDSAIADIDTIERFLDETDPAFARQIARRLLQAADWLDSFPARGAPLGDRDRVLAVPKSPYRLIYRLDADQIAIIRIRHVREDWRTS